MRVNYWGEVKYYMNAWIVCVPCLFLAISLILLDMACKICNLWKEEQTENNFWII